MENGFITQMKDKNGDMWYHQIVIDTINENKDKMYQKLLLYSNELEDRIDEINNLNEKISLALESAEHRLDKAIEYIELAIKCTPSSTRKDIANMILINHKTMLDILKGVDKE